MSRHSTRSNRERLELDLKQDLEQEQDWAEWNKRNLQDGNPVQDVGENQAFGELSQSSKVNCWHLEGLEELTTISS